MAQLIRSPKVYDVCIIAQLTKTGNFTNNLEASSVIAMFRSITHWQYKTSIRVRATHFQERQSAALNAVADEFYAATATDRTRQAVVPTKQSLRETLIEQFLLVVWLESIGS